MIRSLAALLFAVILGLTFAKFVEGGLTAVFEVSASHSVAHGPVAHRVAAGEASAATPTRSVISSGLALVLAASWSLAAFAAAILTLLLARRWAPLAWLAGATIFFNGLIIMVGAKTPWFLWFLAMAGAAGGAFAAIKLLNGQYEVPVAKKRDFNF